MDIKYKIIDFDSRYGQIIVEYEDIHPFAIDLPIDEDGNIPLGEELDAHIKSFLPVWHIDRRNKLKNGLKPEQIAAIEALIGRPNEPQ